MTSNDWKVCNIFKEIVEALWVDDHQAMQVQDRLDWNVVAGYPDTVSVTERQSNRPGLNHAEKPPNIKGFPPGMARVEFKRQIQFLLDLPPASHFSHLVLKFCV